MKKEKQFLEGLRTKEGPGQKLSPLFLCRFFPGTVWTPMRSCRLVRAGN